MKAQDVMTQHVISVGPNDSITRAVHAMLQNDVSGLPVLELVRSAGRHDYRG